jgi:ligand-binding SRPBCC domain-containing protein
VSRIEAWEPPHYFIDVQIRGPFRLWQHRREFMPEGQGTCIRNTVHYRAPCLWLQRTPLLSWVDDDLKRIFTYRQQTIDGLFGDRGL